MISRIPSAKLRQLAGELGRIVDAGAGDAAEEHILRYARTLERQLLAELSRREMVADTEPAPTEPNASPAALLESGEPIGGGR